MESIGTLVCTSPCEGLTLGDEYRVIKDVGTMVMVMNDSGNWKWYNKYRFTGKMIEIEVRVE